MENIQVKEEFSNCASDEDLDYYPDGFQHNFNNDYDYDKENDYIKNESAIDQELLKANENIHVDSVNLPLTESNILNTKQVVNQSEPELKEECREITTLLLHCDICRQRRFTNYGLMKHRLEHTLDTKYTCLNCFKSFITKLSLINHMKRYSAAHTCNVCSKKFNCPSNLNRHKRIHTKEGFKCEYCNYHFAQNNLLEIHKRIHTGELPFPCDICNKRLRSNSLLKQHKAAKHSLKLPRNKSFKCDLCEKRFVYKNSVIRHKIVTHSKKRPYKCNICEKRFKQSSDLKNHIRIHTNERFECDVCHKLFTFSTNLCQHKKSHHTFPKQK